MSKYQSVLLLSKRKETDSALSIAASKGIHSISDDMNKVVTKVW